MDEITELRIPVVEELRVTLQRHGGDLHKLITGVSPPCSAHGISPSCACVYASSRWLVFVTPLMSTVTSLLEATSDALLMLCFFVVTLS